MPYRKFDEFIFLHRKEKIADFYALHAKLRLQTFDGDSDLMIWSFSTALKNSGPSKAGVTAVHTTPRPNFTTKC